MRFVEQLLAVTAVALVGGQSVAAVEGSFFLSRGDLAAQSYGEYERLL